jgi:hypothetical protein
MNRYLYILCAAVVALISCEKSPSEERVPEVNFIFGGVEAQTDEESATVKAVMPYITIDGERVDSPTIYLEYWAVAMPEGVTKVEEYSSSNGYVIFELEELKSGTAYEASITIEAECGKQSSDLVTFTTKEHIPVAEYQCECDIDAMGVLAYVRLDGVSFMLDGVENPLSRVEFKYALATSNNEWVSVDVSSEQLAQGFRIPAEGEAWLEEQSDYNYSVTLYPEDSRYDSYTLNGEFTTEEVQRAMSECELTFTIVDDTLHISSEIPVIYIDGEYIPGYDQIVYRFYYTDNVEDYGILEAKCADGMMSATANLSLFKEGVSYTFSSCLDINNLYRFTSNETSYTIPVTETPTPPTPPDSGDADTTALAGDWHLTQWRGSVPSFDVYLSITEDGVVTLYQRMDSRLWETYYSSVSFDQGIISGVYTDGVSWGASYYVTAEGDTMTWIDTADSGDVSVYTRCTLPDVTNPEIRPTSLSESPRFL